MLSSFRRLSKSTVGTGIMAVILLLILVGFAMGDIQSVIRGGSFSGNSDTLVKIGSEKILDRDVSRAMDRRLSQVRQENPGADMASIMGDYDQLLNALVDAKTLEVFASKFGFVLSKRLEDAQIANIPAAKGITGEFTEQSYQNFLRQSRISDEEVRMIVRDGLLQQMLIAPAVVNARLPSGWQRPTRRSCLKRGWVKSHSSRLQPSGQVSTRPTPTWANFILQNQRRYMVPEQRVLRIAKIGPEQVANIQPSDKEIADYYKANSATYAAKESRVITQAVVQDQKIANGIAQRVRSGQSFVDAAKPAGLSAADISVGPQTKAQLTDLAGAQMANAAFTAAKGAVVGPVQTDLGWRVVKVDDIVREGGKTLEAARARDLGEAGRRQAQGGVEALVDTVQTRSTMDPASPKRRLRVSCRSLKLRRSRPTARHA